LGEKFAVKDILIFSTEPEDRLKDALTKIGVALKKLKNSK
jgi:hypothetical protein